MRLLDSNILIYSTLPQHLPKLVQILADSESVVSEITRLEPLGYHSLTPGDKIFLETTFSTLKTLGIDKAIIDKAIELRQQKKLSAGDAIHAATALIHQLELYTRNTADFTWIPGLKVVNPSP